MRILVADDELDIRDLLTANLTDQGYEVVTATNGKEAYERLIDVEIDLAILDVMMPILDGFNLLRKIREISQVPVIFLTARTSDMDKVLGLGLGADDYLVKPFSIAELLARVGAQLRRSNDYRGTVSAPKQQLTYGDLVLDLDNCCLNAQDTTVDLNAKEFKMLKFFMENPERIFTKKQLYQAIWDEEYYFDDNTIMVHVSRLRSHIELDPQKPRYLKTIRGIGYKLHYLGD